ncbi:hypothetical protein LJC36_01195 [Desulfovibrio sp. OttesenSCG-928-C14]|nr:hypothetical protein [Desulfovibrio sp. OttesenSCG-928-C14]
MGKKLKSDGEKVRSIIADAGGRIVGRTKLQKIAYLLEVAGEGDNFHFEYHHYGPYSEDLTRAASLASIVGDIGEKEKIAKWGGSYSIYTAPASPQEDGIRQHLARTAAEANAVVLELAATAAYFAANGENDPWHETEARKPDKAAEGRLDEAKRLYGVLREISEKLPAI